MTTALKRASYDDVRSALLERREIALLDVREEDPHAQAHPLFAANFPLARIEINAWATLPRRDVPIVTLDDGSGDAERAARKLISLGYSDVAVLDGGIAGWAAAGGELFRDVNAPSKAFGELVESQRHTPSFSAEEVQAIIAAGADAVIVDARRFDEYRTMSIPTATSVPGADLALDVPELAPDPRTQVIVNCAGRTRSIIGTQSLINVGLPNPVAALRNGTIGWTLAGQTLDRGQSRQTPTVNRKKSPKLKSAARDLADRAGVRRATPALIDEWRNQSGRTTYFFDVRGPDEFLTGHLPGWRPYAGGQLVQETEMVAPVRGARIVLVDSDGVRANMTASWLAQMNWDVHVADGYSPEAFVASGPWSPPLPPWPAVELVEAPAVAGRRLAGEKIVIIDLATAAEHRQGHVPDAWFALRSLLAEALATIPPAERYVLTSPDGILAGITAPELQALVTVPVHVLAGGTRAWQGAGLALETGITQAASPLIDRYRRPYEGTDNARDAMQAYLDWEFGLVAQLARDGTHGFRVL